MFDLIDELNKDIWEDKGSPPDEFSSIDDFVEYRDFYILSRKPGEGGKMVYVTTDNSGKHPLTLALIGAAGNADPLKLVRHFHAKIDERDGEIVITTVLLDMDWCKMK